MPSQPDYCRTRAPGATWLTGYLSFLYAVRCGYEWRQEMAAAAAIRETVRPNAGKAIAPWHDVATASRLRVRSPFPVENGYPRFLGP